jgi:hypothetical protein
MSKFNIFKVITFCTAAITSLYFISTAKAGDEKEFNIKVSSLVGTYSGKFENSQKECNIEIKKAGINGISIKITPDNNSNDPTSENTGVFPAFNIIENGHSEYDYSSNGNSKLPENEYIIYTSSGEFENFPFSQLMMHFSIQDNLDFTKDKLLSVWITPKYLNNQIIENWKIIKSDICGSLNKDK